MIASKICCNKDAAAVFTPM